ncbi:MAG TPA: AAA family ATPase [Anaerolineaceae bacterium]
MLCPNCNYDVPTTMLFCGRCGTRLAVKCAACGFHNPLDYAYCGMCGAYLKPDSNSLRESPPDSIPVKKQPELLTNIQEEKETISPALRGENRNATVIIVDLCNSTSLLEKIGGEKWVEFMNRCFHILEEDVYRYGGMVEQFRGDGLLAFFGVKTIHEDDPERAIRAALAMQDSFQHFISTYSPMFEETPLLRIGINTGNVIVANIGNQSLHSEITAMGEAVALAARMETSAEPGTILVSEDTFKLTEPHFEWQELGTIYVKGFEDPIAVYRPLAPLASGQSSLTYLFGKEVPLIGRDEELKQLSFAVSGIFEGRGGIVLLSGDRGIGKSVIVEKLREKIENDHNIISGTLQEREIEGDKIIWLRGRCRSYEEMTPFSIWIDLIQGWIGTQQQMSPQGLVSSLKNEINSLFGDHASEYFPFLAKLLSFAIEDKDTETVLQKDARILRQQIFVSIRALLERLVSSQPLIIYFSDLQWVDPGSLELIKYCIPLCDTSPILWLFSFRSERGAPVLEFKHYLETEYPHRVHLIDVKPLSSQASREFIERLIGPDCLPEETENLLIEHAEGNGYYILQLIQTLIENEVLVPDPDTGKWKTSRPVTRLDMPDTLQRLLMSRISQLSPGEKHVLQVASVIGTTFWMDLLQHLVHESLPLKSHLTALQRAGIILERGQLPEIGMMYVFKSALVRDAAYESLLENQRTNLHLQIANYIENICCHGMFEHYERMLAYHFQNAGVLKKELFYIVQAAEEAKKIYSNLEAIEDYERALRILDEIEKQYDEISYLQVIQQQRFEIVTQLRELYLLMGNLDAAKQSATRILALAQQLEDPSLLVDAYLQQMSVLDWYNKKEDRLLAETYLDTAIQQSKQLGDERRLMECYFFRAIKAQYEDLDWLQKGEEALALSRKVGDKKAEARLLTSLGSACFWSDHIPLAKKFLNDALLLCQEIGDQITEIDIIHEMRLFAEREGDYFRLLTEFGQHRIELARKIGYRSGELNAIISIGECQSIYLGDLDNGLDKIVQARNVLKALSIDDLFVILRLVQIYTMKADYQKAQELLEPLWQGNPNEKPPFARIGRGLATAILNNAIGTEQSAWRSIETIAPLWDLLEAHPAITRQYEVGFAIKTAEAYLVLAQQPHLVDDRKIYLEKALEFSSQAATKLEKYGCIQFIEGSTEEVWFYHSQALLANHLLFDGKQQLRRAISFLKRANKEIIRKLNMIPQESPYRTTFLNNIPLHRDILQAYRMVEVGEGGIFQFKGYWSPAGYVNFSLQTPANNPGRAHH